MVLRRTARTRRAAATYALGQRVEDVTPTAIVDEAYGADGSLLVRYTGDSNNRSFVPFGGHLLAEYYCGGMMFDQPDGLGSLTTATDCTGNTVNEKLFYPFGEAWAGATIPNLGMHQEFAELPDYDPETDQYNTLNRHYTPSGRWTSPDPGGLKAVKLEDPQTWSMYAYVRNNPTTLTDPTGESRWTEWVAKYWPPLMFPHQTAGDPPPTPPPPPPPAIVNYNGHTVLDPRVKQALSEISVHFASSAVKVTSGDRPTDPNGSPHLGHAADFHVIGRSDSQVDQDLKDSSSPLRRSGGFRLLQHGPHTETEGAHLHLDDVKTTADRPASCTKA